LLSYARYVLPLPRPDGAVPRVPKVQPLVPILRQKYPPSHSVKTKLTHWNDEDCCFGLSPSAQYVDWIDPAQDVDRLRDAWFQVSGVFEKSHALL
jgi:hypothetical protein